MSKALSSNMEMYLKTILRLGADGQPVRVKAIAEALGVTMPSVSEALRSLRARGLVLHPSYGAVQLSARGRRTAEAINLRFEILQRFFTDVLQVAPRTAARDACEIEHVMGPETLQRLTAFLDYMQHCRMDISGMIEHFHEYLELRLAGERCRDCELEATCELVKR
ncbi:MAG TPA: metal-dependent transcriptional regulator [bacterium]|nr:metal-dependent transcriptional regulator [bacterium]